MTASAERRVFAPVDGGRAPLRGGGMGCRTLPHHRGTSDPRGRCPDGSRWHAGLDVRAPEGTPIRSVGAGRVVVAGTANGVPRFGNYGRVVVVRAAPETFLLYAHLQRVDVAEGQELQPGEVLGTVGRTRGSVSEPGRMFGASGAHLHFEVRRRPVVDYGDGNRDPIEYLRATGVTVRESRGRYVLSDGARGPERPRSDDMARSTPSPADRRNQARLRETVRQQWTSVRTAGAELIQQVREQLLERGMGVAQANAITDTATRSVAGELRRIRSAVESGNQGQAYAGLTNLRASIDAGFRNLMRWRPDSLTDRMRGLILAARNRLNREAANLRAGLEEYFAAALGAGVGVGIGLGAIALAVVYAMSGGSRS